MVSRRDLVETADPTVSPSQLPGTGRILEGGLCATSHLRCHTNTVLCRGIVPVMNKDNIPSKRGCPFGASVRVLHTAVALLVRSCNRYAYIIRDSAITNLQCCAKCLSLSLPSKAVSSRSTGRKDISSIRSRQEDWRQRTLRSVASPCKADTLCNQGETMAVHMERYDALQFVT